MLRILSALAGLAAVGLSVSAFADATPAYLPFCAAVVAVVLVLTARLPKLMRFLIGLFSLSFLILAVTIAASAAGLVPQAVLPYLPPPDSAIVAMVLVLINYGMTFVPVVRGVIDLAAPYFESEERGELDLGIFGKIRGRETWIALGLFGVIIAINVAQVYMNVLFSFWNNRFYSALQDKNAVVFWHEIIYFVVLATFWVAIAMYEYVLSQLLDLRWRRWLSLRYIERWLDGSVHYRMRLTGDEADNPDQRISEDVRDFVTGSRAFYIQLFSSSLNLYAFVQILWGLSARFPYALGSFDLAVIPGYLVWIALTFAVLATIGTHLIGRSLVTINFLRQRYEADFRFNLVRVRENAEQIALLDGEPVEKKGLMARFGNVIDITLTQIRRQKKVVGFTFSYDQASVILPFLVLGPAYFLTSDMKLGDLTQTAGAFSRVQDAFSIFVSLYISLASYKAVVNRLTGFDTAIAHANMQRGHGVLAAETAAADVSAENLTVRLPNGRALIENGALTLRRGEDTLVTGASGSGKTTLFRALAGIWPFGSGTVHVPKGEDVMLLPQQTYLPLGTLRAALTYPADASAFSDAEVHAALDRVGLSDKAPLLDTEENWSNALSGGEKQRVAMVRALLRKPRWLFLDEATAALDEPNEARLYAALREALPETTIVSIGHRSSLAALHERRVALEKSDDGARLVDAPLAAFGPAKG